ncbi:MAG: LPS-assembly protein LptD [Flavobacteriales bacterium]|nr:LPS-assembly protein LptD [Flavobacteriales bacterium]
MLAVDARAQALESEVRYEARDSIRYDLRRQTVYLFGAATVKYEGVQLSAERISFSFKNEEASAFGAPDSTGAVTGKPRFTQEGHTFEADSIRYNFRTKTGLIREVRTEEQGTWVHAGLSKRRPDGEVHGLGGMLTTCDRPKPHYHFKVTRMIVMPDDKIVAGPAYMKVGNVPTPLAVPFGLFPNKKGRSSGILIPVWGSSDQLGYFLLNGGYYLPLSDHWDVQLTGDIYSRGSWAARTITRYRTRYRYSGNLDLNHSTLLSSDPEFPDFSRQQNFFVRWNHQVDPRASLTDRFSASVNVGTSANFTNNFNSSTNDFLSNTFQSNIAWSRIWPGKPYNVAVNLRHSQNTLNRTFDITAPAITANLQRIFPVQMLRRPGAPSRWYDQFGLNWSTSFDNRLSTTEERLYWGNLPTLAGEMRNGVRNTGALTTTLKNRFFSLNPEMRFTNRIYFDYLALALDPETNTTRRDTLPGLRGATDWSAGATLTSKVFFTYTYRGGWLKAIRHVITPSAGFNYRPDTGTEITGPFGPDGGIITYSPFDIGIYGKPSSGESGSINLGLIQNIEAKVRDRKGSTPGEEATKKIKLIDFLGITGNYDMLRDSLRWSPVNIAARTALFNKLNLNLVSLWDPLAVNAQGQRIDRPEAAVSGRLARMVYTNVALGFDVKSPKYGQAIGEAPANDQQVVEETDPGKGARINFSLPWRLGLNYSYDINRIWFADSFTDNDRQSVLFNGDINILKHWKLGFSSGYDLVAEEFTPSSINLYWDLHCWEFNLNVIPTGLRKSFMFRINVKASILKDLKFEQRRPYGGDPGLLY